MRHGVLNYAFGLISVLAIGCGQAAATLAPTALGSEDEDDERRDGTRAEPSDEAQPAGKSGAASAGHESTGPFEDVCPQMDTAAVPENANEEIVEKICEHGTEEMLADYAGVMEVDQRRDRRKSDINGARRCIDNYLKAEAAIAEGEEPSTGYGKTYFDMCNRHCTDRSDSETVASFQAKYREECAKARERWAGGAREDERGQFREALSQYLEAMHEESWPLYLERQYQRANTILVQAREYYGEDDPLVEEFASKLKAIERGDTGRMLKRARAFERRDDIQRLQRQLGHVDTRRERERLQERYLREAMSRDLLPADADYGDDNTRVDAPDPSLR